MKPRDRADAYFGKRLHEIVSETSPFEGMVTIEDKRRDVRLRIDFGELYERRYASNLLLGLPYPQADIDAFLLELVLNKGDRCVDAGSNIGATAYHMRVLEASEVLCFEPTPVLAERAEALENKGVTIRKVALGDKVESRELFVSKKHNQGSTIAPHIVDSLPGVFGKAPERVQVDVSTLDYELLETGIDPNFQIWKVDIEGAEYDCFEGACQALCRVPPRAILLECYGSVEPIMSILGDEWFGYRAFVKRTPYALALQPLDAVDDRAVFFETAPMYLLLHRPQMQDNLMDQLSRLTLS